MKRLKNLLSTACATFLLKLPQIFNIITRQVIDLESFHPLKIRETL